MKKLTSLLLAAIMLCSLSITAFAATYYYDGGPLVIVDDNALDGGSYYQPGITYDILLETDSYSIDDEFNDVWRLTCKVTSGKDHVSSATIVTKGDYTYLRFKPKASTKYLGEVHTVIVTITARERNLKSSDYRLTSQSEINRYQPEFPSSTLKIGDYVYPEFVSEIDLDIGYPDITYINDDEDEVDNDNPICVAEYVGRSKLLFGDYATYDARFSSSSTRKYNLGYNFTENGSVVKNNPNADMRFVNFIGTPIFSYSGTLRVYLGGVKYLYQIKGSELVLLDASTVTSNYIEHRTDQLTSYVASDRRLTGQVVSDSSSGTTTTPTTPPTPTTGTTSATASSLTITAASNAGKSAAITARGNGWGTAYVTLNNIGTCSLEAFQAMRSAAAMPVSFSADSMSADGKAVNVRVTVNAGLCTSALNLSGSIASADTSSTKTFFERWFANKMVVISLGQNGAYGQTVSVAARVSLTGMNTKNLYFYSYNASNNTYTRITAPAYWIDTAGYLRFNTTLGGKIVVTDGVLVSK